MVDVLYRNTRACFENVLVMSCLHLFATLRYLSNSSSAFSKLVDGGTIRKAKRNEHSPDGGLPTQQLSNILGSFLMLYLLLG